jgi:hypothetical protein
MKTFTGHLFKAKHTVSSLLRLLQCCQKASKSSRDISCDTEKFSRYFIVFTHIFRDLSRKPVWEKLKQAKLHNLNQELSSGLEDKSTSYDSREKSMREFFLGRKA